VRKQLGDCSSPAVWITSNSLVLVNKVSMSASENSPEDISAVR
jgi:hypothetical protein